MSLRLRYIGGILRRDSRKSMILEVTSIDLGLEAIKIHRRVRRTGAEIELSCFILIHEDLVGWKNFARCAC